MNRYLSKFFNELLLNSGQYALFYILMYFSYEGGNFWLDIGHVILLLSLIIQTIILTKYGNLPKVRFFGSLIAPLVYTFFEYTDIILFLSDSGHFFFWFFSIVTAMVQTYQLKCKNEEILDYLLTSINVIIFIFIYFYFDLKISVEQQLKNGLITYIEAIEKLEFYNFLIGLKELLLDPAHIYLIIGAILLTTTIIISKLKINNLRKRLFELLGAYVDTKVRDKLLQKGQNLIEKKEVVVLFSDIRNFTALSEQNSASDIVSMLNEYFSLWNSIVTKYGGVVDKYMGDAIMVVFEGKNDSQRSVNCSIEILNSIEKLNGELKGKSLPIIPDIGIGIHKGEVIQGPIGSNERKNYTVIGDVVNIASRLESSCKELSTHLVVSKQIRAEVNGFVSKGSITLKGKKDNFEVYILEG